MLTTIHDKSKAENISGIEALQDLGIKKEELLTRMNEGDYAATILLYLGMVSHKYTKFMGEFEDDDTGETILVERKIDSDECLYESEQGEREELDKKISSFAKELEEESLRLCWDLFDKEKLPFAIAYALADMGDPSALEWLGDYHAGSFTSDFQLPVDKTKAIDYYEKALRAGLDKGEYDLDLLRLECGLRRSDSFEWVFDSDAFSDLLGWFGYTDSDKYSDVEWTFDYCYWTIITNLLSDEFPSAFVQSYCTGDKPYCTLDGIKAELISRGVPPSAFQDSPDGIVVDLKHLSFYVKYYSDENNEVHEGVLSIAPFMHEEVPFLTYMEDVWFSVEDYADTMIDLDKKVPAVKMALSLVYDKMMEERTIKPKQQKEAQAYIESVFGGVIPEEITSVSVDYLYGANDSGKHKYCREVVGIAFNHELLGITCCDYGIKIYLEDLPKIPKVFFEWYVHQIDTSNIYADSSYQLEIEQDEDGKDVLVIIDTSRNEKLLTTRLDSLTYDQLVSMRPLW